MFPLGCSRTAGARHRAGTVISALMSAFPAGLKGKFAVVATIAPLQTRLAAIRGSGLVPLVSVNPLTSTFKLPSRTLTRLLLAKTHGAPARFTPNNGGSLVTLPTISARKRKESGSRARAGAPVATAPSSAAPAAMAAIRVARVMWASRSRLPRHARVQFHDGRDA